MKMYVFFATFAFLPICQASKFGQPCDIVKEVFKIYKEAVRMYNSNASESVVNIYINCSKLIWFGDSSNCKIHTKLPNAEYCDYIFDDKNTIFLFTLAHITGKPFRRQGYYANPDQVCGIIQAEGKKFLKKFKQLLDNEPSENNKTLDNFCKSKPKECKYDYKINELPKKFEAYLLDGFDSALKSQINYIKYNLHYFEIPQIDTGFLLRNSIQTYMIERVKACLLNIKNNVLKQLFARPIVPVTFDASWPSVPNHLPENVIFNKFYK